MASIPIQPARGQINRTNGEDRAGSIAMSLVVCVGALLRLMFLAKKRSLWLDEASLSLNFLERNFGGLLKPLSHDQVAPVGFVVLEKVVVSILGPGEIALRLLPCIAGISTLCLFCLLCRKLFPSRVAILVGLLYAIMPPGFRYSGECKPYILDSLATVLLLWQSLAVIENEVSAYSWGKLALTGALLSLFSFTSFLVTPVCFLVLLMTRWQAGSRLKALLAFFAWAATAGTVYALFMHSSQNRSGLLDYWSSAFMPFPPKSLKDLSWSYEAMYALFEVPVGFAKNAALGLGLALLGAVGLWRCDRRWMGLLVGPLIAAFVASALRKYPFGERLSLFLVPCMLLLVGFGFGELYRNSNTRVGVLVFGLLLFVLPIYADVNIFRYAYKYEELRPLLVDLAGQIQKSDRLLVADLSRNPFEYYRKYCPSIRWTNAPEAEFFSDRPIVFPEVDSRRTWLIITHLDASVTDAYEMEYRRRGYKVKRVDQPGAWMLEISPPSPERATAK